jgi:hypothetical protein
MKYPESQKIGKPNNLKVLAASKPKVVNRIGGKNRIFKKKNVITMSNIFFFWFDFC